MLSKITDNLWMDLSIISRVVVVPDGTIEYVANYSNKTETYFITSDHTATAFVRALEVYYLGA